MTRLGIGYLFAISLTSLFTSCENESEATQRASNQALIYWQNQFDVLADIGPYKDDIRVWLAELDPKFEYTELQWIAEFPTEPNSENQTKDCIRAIIAFDEQERIQNYQLKYLVVCEK